MAVSVVFATKEVSQEGPTPPSAYEQREALGIASYLETNVLQRNETWSGLGETDPRQIALNWIVHKDKMQLETLDQRLAQRFILALLAFSFDSLAWKFCGNHRSLSSPEEEYAVDSCVAVDEAGMEKESSVWLSNTFECDWHGVMCADDSVVGLNLSECLPKITLTSALFAVCLHLLPINKTKTIMISSA